MPASRGLVPEGASPQSFSAGASRISTRDVQRATGNTFNQWVEFDSTNVEKAKVEPQYDLNGKLTGVGTIIIQFLNGWEYTYDDRPMGDWFDLIESSSKGRYTYYEVRGEGPSIEGHTIWIYSHKRQVVNRTAAEVAKLQATRQPKGARQQKRTYTRGGRRGAYGAGGRPVPRPPSMH